MTNAKLSKSTLAFGFSLAVTSLLNALLVVAKELSPSLMIGMKRLTGQHWVTHSLAAVVVFGILGWVFSRANGGRGLSLSVNRLIMALAGGVIIGSLIIAGFYLMGG